MRIPIATDLKTRTGAPDTKDARLKNCYVESKGPMNDPNNPPQTAVRKRPIAQGGIAVGTGTAQGGIGLNVNGVPYFFGFWSDVLYPYSSTGTTWSSSTSYLTGDMVSVNFKDYYSTQDNNSNKNPTSNPSYWSPNYVSPIPRLTKSPSGGVISVSLSSSTVGTFPGPYTNTQTIQVVKISGGTTLYSGTGVWISTSYDSILMPNPYFSFSNYVFSSSSATDRRAGDITAGLTIPPIPPGYDYYFYNASATWNGTTYIGSGAFTPL